MFAEKYRDLYTSVQYDVSDMLRILDEVVNMLSNDSSCIDVNIGFHDVKLAVSHFNAHKNDGSSELFSE